MLHDCRYCGKPTEADVACSIKCIAGLRRMAKRLPIDWRGAPPLPAKKPRAPSQPTPHHKTWAARDAVATDGTCAICKALPDKKNLAYDHDHATGALRGRLCHHCNMGLGLFKDNADTLRTAAEYIEKWK